jgi:plastocyanin
LRKKSAIAVLALAAVACAGAGRSGEGGPTRVRVQAEDFKFGGVPSTLPQGITTFVLENVGQEPHEFGLAKITGDKPIGELVRLPRNQVGRFIKQVGGIGAKPGEESSFRATLRTGRYGYVCFVETKGKPHVAMGMFGEFTVEET